MTTPGDESRTDLAWREIVDNYGDRVVLPDETETETDSDTGHEGGHEAEHRSDPSAAFPLEDTDHGPGSDVVDDTRDEVATVERFQPPAAPPIPLPRTWERAAAWGGIFLAPVIALLIALLDLSPPTIVGWALVAWLVGGFGYLVYDMPRSPREPWDDGSRV